MAIGPQLTNVLDDVGPVTGSVGYGAYTNDASPLVTVSLGDQAVVGDTIRLTDNGATIATVVLGAQDLTRGSVDFQLSGLSETFHPLAVVLQGSDGAEKANSGAPFAIGVSTTTPTAPIIQTAVDDVGAHTGAIADGTRTDDSTPTFTIFEDGLPPIPTGSPGHAPFGGPPLLSGLIKLYDGSTLVGQTQIGFGGEVAITTSTLAAGDHVLTAVAVDRAGNVSGPSASFHLTVGPDAGAGGGATATAGGGTATATSGGGATATASSGSGASGQTMVSGAAGGSLQGSGGADTMTGGAGEDHMRGGDGADRMVGGDGFDDMNGNMGADSLWGGQGDDWVVGGKDADQLFGDDGADIVLGNLGDDVCDGGAGDDLIRGGQSNDVLRGGTGADWLSGDRGSDTITGGAGADIFHTFGDAGLDRVTDFNLAEGDRVMVDPGTTYSFAQVGADTVITLGGGGEMVLVGVQASTLTSGWIFGG